jgi:peptide/nickel transport system substrate-binding protein
VGIDVRINNAPSAVLFDDPFLQHAVDGSWKGAIEFAWVGNPITEDASTIYCDDPSSPTQRDNVPTNANAYAGQNIGGWCNAEFDRLWSQARQELDADKRKAIFAQMQQIFIREVPMISLYNRLEILTTRKGLLNYVYNGPTRYPSMVGWQIGWQQRGQRQVYNPAQVTGVSAIR